MNLIAHDLVLVHPMTSMSGYVSYLSYTAGSNKGQTRQGDLFNNPFKLGDIDVDYTAARVVESFTGATSPVTASWFPVYTGPATEAQARITSIVTNAGVVVPVADDASVTVADDGKTLTLSNGTGTAIQATDTVKVAYVYDNIAIPQNDIPQVTAKMDAIPLIAKARRVAIYFSQMAAYQAKTDYGVDLSAQLAEHAAGILSYNIDTEVTDGLYANAAESGIEFDRTQPVGVSLKEHYDAFAKTIEEARVKIYDATKKFNPNWMLVSSSLMPILTLMTGFKAAPAGQVNGPYFAGTVSGLKVFVTPNIPTDRFVVGVLGNDMYTAAAVFAPYMAIVPTQLLQYADGGTSQGFSTLYDFKMLNPALLVRGKVIGK